MNVPHYINDDKSDMRGIKPGWYAVDENGGLLEGPFVSYAECLCRHPIDVEGALSVAVRNRS